MLENFLADLKASLTVSPIVKDIEILDEFITSVSGFLDYVSEYFTVLDNKIKRDKYSYHLQKNDELIIRCDNVPHHRELSTFPFHIHKKDGVQESQEMTVNDILEELSKTIL